MSRGKNHRVLGWAIGGVLLASLLVALQPSGIDKQRVLAAGGPTATGTAPTTVVPLTPAGDAPQVPALGPSLATGPNPSPGGAPSFALDAPARSAGSSTSGSHGSQQNGPAAKAVPLPPPGPIGVVGPLSTRGNRIVDGSGHPVVLRGINRTGLHEMGAAPPVTDGELDHARGWGVTIVRVLATEAYMDPGCPNYAPSYLDALDAVVHGVTSRGMVALVTLTTVTRVPCGQLDRWRMADKPGSINFWHAIASRYKDNALVAFDLYNEPNNISNDEWRNGGLMEDVSLAGTVRWTAAGMQELYDAVRSTGATNLITVSANGWADDPSPVLNDGPLRGTNIVYAVHSYTCSHINEPWCTGNPANKKARVRSNWAQLIARYPVMITEFGWPVPTEGAYNASVIQYAESQDPPLGWIAFAWDGTQNNYFILVGDLTTYDPSPSGTPVKAALQARR